jgi:hypothetical protein
MMALVRSTFSLSGDQTSHLATVDDDHPGWVLPTALVYKGRTFLGTVAIHADVLPTHSGVQPSRPLPFGARPIRG